MSLDIALTEEQDGELIEVHNANITHNLSTMARECGVSVCTWDADKNNFKVAKDFIKPLSRGITILLNNPEYFQKFNPENGWGSFEGLVEFLKHLQVACIKHPEAIVTVSK